MYGLAHQFDYIMMIWINLHKLVITGSCYAHSAVQATAFMLSTGKVYAYITYMNSIVQLGGQAELPLKGAHIREIWGSTLLLETILYAWFVFCVNKCQHVQRAWQGSSNQLRFTMIAIGHDVDILGENSFDLRELFTRADQAESALILTQLNLMAVKSFSISLS